MDKENEFKTKHEELTQRIIDPTTGRDITGEYINQRLKELEKIADKKIQQALKQAGNNKSTKNDIYQNAYWEIHEKLGMGSIGPATAAAGPLMEKKFRELALILDINTQDRLSG